MTNVVEAEIADGACRLPWGDVRPLENPDAKGVEGVAIRPEDLLVEPVANDEHGTIEQSMFMGAATHYWIKAAGRTFRSIASGGGSAILPKGQKVRLVAPPQLHLLRTYPASPTGAA
jgi:putative spermidine/putrescine transport system ATP-binding protein